MVCSYTNRYKRCIYGKNENYLDIINGFKRFSFDTLFFEITNLCNYQCKHCYNASGSQGRSMNLENFKNITEQFIQQGIESVILSGGEALLHKELWQMIDFLKENQLKISILTNGKLLSKENIKRLKDLNVDLQISLDGASAQTNDYIRQVGSFNDVMSALKELHHQNYTHKVSIHSVITNINVEEVSQIVEIANQFSIADLSFSFINPMGRAKDNDLMISHKELYRVITQINHDFKFSKTTVKPIGITKNCRFCTDQEEIVLNPVVDVKGNMYMCEFLRDEIFSIGNLLKQTLPEILSGSKIKKNMLILNLRSQYIAACRTCFAKTKCCAGCIMQNNDDNYFEPHYCYIIKKDFIRELGG